MVYTECYSYFGITHTFSLARYYPFHNGFQTQYGTQLTGKAGNQTTNEIIQEIQSLTLAERAIFNERLKPQILSEMKGSTYL